MTHIDLKRNPALLRQAADEVWRALWKNPLRPHPAHMRAETIRTLAQALHHANGLYVARALPAELKSPYFGESRLSAGGERSIREGNASMEKIRRALCRRDIVETLIEKASVTRPTAEQITEQFIFTD